MSITRIRQSVIELSSKLANSFAVLKMNFRKIATNSKNKKKELLATDNAEEFRQKGELLTTFLHQVPNDQDQVTLDNYYTNQPTTIALDKALTPSQNASTLF